MIVTIFIVFTCEWVFNWSLMFCNQKNNWNLFYIFNGLTNIIQIQRWKDIYNLHTCLHFDRKNSFHIVNTSFFKSVPSKIGYAILCKVIKISSTAFVSPKKYVVDLLTFKVAHSVLNGVGIKIGCLPPIQSVGTTPPTTQFVFNQWSWILIVMCQ